MIEFLNCITFYDYCNCPIKITMKRYSFQQWRELSYLKLDTIHDRFHRLSSRLILFFLPTNRLKATSTLESINSKWTRLSRARISLSSHDNSRVNTLILRAFVTRIETSTGRGKCVWKGGRGANLAGGIIYLVDAWEDRSVISERNYPPGWEGSKREMKFQLSGYVVENKVRASLPRLATCNRVDGGGELSRNTEQKLDHPFCICMYRLIARERDRGKCSREFHEFLDSCAPWTGRGSVAQKFLENERRFAMIRQW